MTGQILNHKIKLLISQIKSNPSDKPRPINKKAIERVKSYLEKENLVDVKDITGSSSPASLCDMKERISKLLRIRKDVVYDKLKCFGEKEKYEWDDEKIDDLIRTIK